MHDAIGDPSDLGISVSLQKGAITLPAVISKLRYVFSARWVYDSDYYEMLRKLQPLDTSKMSANKS